MNVIKVQGGNPLYGRIKLQGSKNATLPILAATVMIKGTCVIKNCPQISDVDYMIKLLQFTGCHVKQKADTVIIDAGNLCNSCLPREYVQKMRSSVILLGPLLARKKEATLDYPGGCVIGERPIDMHINALKQLGVCFEEKEGAIFAWTKELNGNCINFPFPSVGATQNTILAAVLAKGKTILKNCAKEPEVTDLCNFLVKAGARIEGIGSGNLVITGVEALHEVEYFVDYDRIVAGTYLYSCVATGGDIILEHAPVHQMQEVLRVAEKMGCTATARDEELRICMKGTPRAIPYLQTEVYPGFPTDLQSVLLVAVSVANGDSCICESIFENRYKCVEQLNRIGTAIEVRNRNAFVKGNRQFTGGYLVAEDLRGGAALVMAGVLSPGETYIENSFYIDRGYEDICRDYSNLGVRIERHGEKN